MPKENVNGSAQSTWATMQLASVQRCSSPAVKAWFTHNQRQNTSVTCDAVDAAAPPELTWHCLRRQTPRGRTFFSAATTALSVSGP
eukprot:2509956-Rhodomonas_salina.1